jgi:hypothetical protein
MVIGYEMDDQISFPSWEFTLCHRVHTVSGAYKDSYPKDVGDSFSTSKESRA